MNAAPEFAPPPRWPPARWLTLIALILAAHVALIFAFGARHARPVRAVRNVPVLQLTQGAHEWLALNDPTLLALPHSEGFDGPAWLEPLHLHFIGWEWSEPPRWLSLSNYPLGAVFSRFLQTNRFARIRLELKMAPRLTALILPAQPAPVEVSTVRVTGDLAKRKLLAPLNPPSVPFNDVIRPSRVQVLVDEAGRVVSGVLLSSSGASAADREALALARAARFAPLPHADVSVKANLASRLTFGQLIFHWHTVPRSDTNAPPATNEPIP